MILAKAEGTPVTPPTNRGPSNFSTPPSRGRPSQPVYVPKYRTAPKIVNPGCAGGPRSITVLSQSKSSKQDSVREISAHDGVKGRLTDKSTKHLTSKHGHEVDIDDLLPPNPNQKPTNYEKTQTRTRINKKNNK